MPEQPSPLRESYRARIAAGELKPNAAQAEAVEILQNFADRFYHYTSPLKREATIWKRLSNLLSNASSASTTERKPGLYLHGKVGRGKSMLMDMFVEHVAIVKKRRVHFHQFMLEIHARLNQLRQGTGVADIMLALVNEIADETSLLAFDEFHVSNIADAMILGRLFAGLFDAGVLIVATSNWAPDELYKNGLQRDRFLPFIELIKTKMQVHEIGGAVDYRFEQLRYIQSYFTPLGLETTRKLQGIFLDLTHEAKPEPITLPVEGRTITIARAAQGIGFFNFDELCGRPLGAADYLAIARCLHTLILDGVPLLREEHKNEAVRFMTLIDSLYEAKVNLFMASEASVAGLAVAKELTMPFQRTISRLMEMQSESYRLKSHLSFDS